MKWIALFHERDANQNQWSTPKGLMAQIKNLGAEVINIPFKKPECFYFPNIDQLLTLGADVIIIFYAGQSRPLEQWMAALRVAIDQQGKQIVVVSELGDEPQTQSTNAVRVQLSDLCITPDVECANFWRNLGCDAHWLTHWADEEIFYRNQSCARKNHIATTMGKRKYACMLKLLFGSKFINRTNIGIENNFFYNSALIAFQYARWGEVTRRIFEAGACGCCVLTNRLNHKKCLEKIFEDGKSVVLYRNRLDLVLKLIKYLYLESAEAKRIGNQAATVIQRNHTASARARQLLNIVENKLSGEAPDHDLYAMEERNRVAIDIAAIQASSIS